MNRKQAWILFIVCFVVVCAFTILIVNAFDDIVAKQVKDDVTADWVGLMELPELTPIENTVFITHYLPEEDRKNVRNYSILYDTIAKLSYWVAYPLHKIYLGNSGRSEAWDYDPLVSAHLQPKMQRGIKGFDRGHQLPSADRTYSSSGNATTFYFTNMTAQNASLNRGAWSRVERKVRTWVARCDTLYVVTGAMITATDDNEIRYAKDNDGHDMAIPKYYYKAVAQKTGTDYYTIAYKFDNAAPTKRNIDDYQVTVTALEELTGFVFFPTLPKEIKDTIVSKRWR